MKDRAGPAGLSRQLEALQQTAELGRDRLDPGTVEQAEALIDKARERLAKGAEVVVAALAGGTGSGKSSLFNALAGATLAEVGPRRPTTADARAWAVGDPSGSRALLDWLGVKQRHAQPPGPGAPDGLVLLDLPDHDSVEVDHRFVVDRFVERVDMLIWVVDPLKYAQRALHAGYLRALALHADVMVVVLNRIDQLAPADRRACRSDLKRLLDAEGLSRTPILTTSATTGEGVDELRALIA
ncbi:MAG TPA: GTPase, partial [Egibacteraceae bacterium]|nr:GTPase [Egibacteraceae bacterium]